MNKKAFATLFLAVFSVTLGVGLIVPLLPVYAHTLGASGLAIGFIFGAFSITRTAFLPVFGRLSDVKGRKPFITIGLLGYFIVSIGFSLSQDVAVFIVIRFFQGIASAMILPVAQAYIGEMTSKNQEGFVMGLFNVSLYGGLSLGPVMGGAINDALGIQASFVSMGLVSLLGFFLCLFLLPPRKEEHFFQKARSPVQYRAVMKNRNLAALFVFRVSFTTCVGMVWAFLPLLADSKFRLSSSAIGILVMLGVLIAGILQTPMGLLADRMNKKLLIGIGGLVVSGSVFSLLFAQGFWGLFLTNTLFGIGGGIAMPAVMAMTVIIGRQTHAMGSVMGLLTMGHSLGMFVGPVLAGIMMDAFHLDFAFVLGTAVMVFGTVGVLIFTSGFQREPEERGDRYL
jgi:MFS family permease